MPQYVTGYAELLARRLSHVFTNFKLCFRVLSLGGTDVTVQKVLTTAKAPPTISLLPTRGYLTQSMPPSQVLGHHLYGTQATAALEAGMEECRATALRESPVECHVAAALPDEEHHSDTGLSIVGFCRVLSYSHSPILLGAAGKKFLHWIAMFLREMKSVAEVFEEKPEGFWGPNITKESLHAMLAIMRVSNEHESGRSLEVTEEAVDVLFQKYGSKMDPPGWTSGGGKHGLRPIQNEHRPHIIALVRMQLKDPPARKEVLSLLDLCDILQQPQTPGSTEEIIQYQVRWFRECFTVFDCI